MMLRSIRAMQGTTLQATDGPVGWVDHLLFDDTQWTIRYLVANAGNWLFGRRVLLSPYAVEVVDWDENNIRLNLTRQQIEDSPPLATDQPVSRQFETDYTNYYQYPTYWGNIGSFGMGTPLATVDPVPPVSTSDPIPSGDPHLRSTEEVIGYSIGAHDDELGHVSDFIFDDETWIIRYMVVATRNWLPGKKVLVSPGWISEVSWLENSVIVDLDKETIKNGPEYDPDALLDREFEATLYQHYGKTTYWENAINQDK